MANNNSSKARKYSAVKQPRAEVDAHEVRHVTGLF